MSLILPVTEQSFSKLKVIKTYPRSSIGQERQSSHATLSIKSTRARELNIKDIVKDFAQSKGHRISMGYRVPCPYLTSFYIISESGCRRAPVVLCASFSDVGKAAVYAAVPHHAFHQCFFFISDSNFLI